MKWTITKDDLSGLDVELLNPKPNFLPDQEVFSKKFSNHGCLLARVKVLSVSGDSASGKVEYLLNDNSTVNNDDLINSDETIKSLFEDQQLDLLDGEA